MEKAMAKGDGHESARIARVQGPMVSQLPCRPQHLRLRILQHLGKRESASCRMQFNHSNMENKFLSSLV